MRALSHFPTRIFRRFRNLLRAHAILSRAWANSWKVHRFVMQNAQEVFAAECRIGQLFWQDGGIGHPCYPPLLGMPNLWEQYVIIYKNGEIVAVFLFSLFSLSFRPFRRTYKTRKHKHREGCAGQTSRHKNYIISSFIKRNPYKTTTYTLDLCMTSHFSTTH